jgi:hypothetical protein
VGVDPPPPPIHTYTSARKKIKEFLKLGVQERGRIILNGCKHETEIVFFIFTDVVVTD